MKDNKEVIVYSKQTMHFLEELVGGANHEINNLLFIIGMSSEILEGSQDVKERKEAVSNIESQVQRIGQIFKDLRSVIKDCGTEEVKPTKVSEISDKVIDLCKARFNNHKIILKNNVPEDIMIDGRQTQLTQAFLAILNSSHDAIVQHKSKAKWINFDIKTNDKELEVLISDSSLKLSDLEISKIFTPSYDEGGRKGLPLFIAKNIVESHGGELKILNTEDTNIFSIKFKSYSKAQAAKQKVPFLKVV